MSKGKVSSITFDTTDETQPQPTPREKPPELIAWEKRRDQLQGMSSQELLAVEDDRDLCIHVGFRLLQKARLKGREALSVSERDVLLAMRLHGEVSSGGFHQFFFNSSGDQALEIHEALKRMEAVSILPLYEKALAAFPDSKPARDHLVRNDQLTALGDQEFSYFSPLSSAYHQQSLAWSKECAAFIRKHRGEFDVPP
jgi:hypothetical protein